MRILFLHSSSDLYGASRVFYQTIRICNEAGHHCKVCLSAPGDLATNIQKLGIEVEYIRMGVLRRKYMNIPGILNRLYFILNATYKLLVIIRRNKIDLVYNNASSIFSGCFAARIAGKPHLWHVHEIISKPTWFVKMVAFIMNHLSDLNVVVSKATYDHWEAVTPTLSRKMKVIYNGLSEQFINPQAVKDDLLEKKRKREGELWIGMIGRVHFWKGQTYFLEIAAKLAMTHKNLQFVMAGDAFPGYEYLYDEINEKIHQLGLEEKIIDLGYVNDSRKFYQIIDLLILPSILPDPLPTTVLEGMAYRKPVIATSHGGATEMIIDGETGALIPWDDAAKAAEIIEPYIIDEQLRIKTGQAAHQRIRDHFTLTSYQDEILSTLAGLYH
jgi:glycosyltransferase involved in cell wall biosynthesis